ncbi:hypothetical protein [Salmonirosea aquatica]|uniref:Uncharacterized protein n=1 Tax=Salmonirosea aquatica TaxID=2654236 RepID=A0A7C9FFB5_9BACT|nr:hypothetical protein [Cytophagaceae bacterium SJW1-29]
MILPYTYPDGRESRHVRYKFSPWGTSVGLFDVSLQYRIKGCWRYRWYNVVSIVYHPGGKITLEAMQKKLLDLAEDQRRDRMHFRKFMNRFPKSDSE